MTPLCPKCGHTTVRAGHTRGKQRWECKPRGCGWHGTEPIHPPAPAIRGLPSAKRYVVTAAQNATPVYKPFFHRLVGYCQRRGAELLVIPYRYKNPTSVWSKDAADDDWWAPELAPYLFDSRVKLHPKLELLADIKTQPTAARPLQGFETISGRNSAIIGHPKLELLTVPTPQASFPKLLTTTGACTVPNYIPSKAGKKGEFHHTFGACVVELGGNKFHLRQINAERDGQFYDLANVEAIVMGDTHAEFVDPKVLAATKDMIAQLKPKFLVWHDVHDFYARNHHHRGKLFTNFVKHHHGRDNVEAELRRTFALIDEVTPPGCRNIFVPSNHPDALARWVEETDPRTDPENAVFWARTFEAMATQSRWTDTGAKTIDPFAYWGRQMLDCADRSVFLTRDEGFQIKGVEVGQHGDAGPNGSRGSIRGFGRIGVKSVIGHGHSPGIQDGVYQVGTSSHLGLEYVRGPSSWLNTHCLIYGNGKRTLVNIIDGEWRA